MTMVSTPPQKDGSASAGHANSFSILRLSLTIAGLAALVACAISLIGTNAHPAPGCKLRSHRYLVALHSGCLAAVVALLGAMAVFRLKAHVAAVIGLVTALTIAIIVYRMPCAWL